MARDVLFLDRGFGMLRIRRSADGEVLYTLSGEIDQEDIAGLETLIKSEDNGLGIVLDLRNLTLVGRDAIGFLERCEAHGVTLTNCSGYVREWITRLRSATPENTVHDGKE